MTIRFLRESLEGGTAMENLERFYEILGVKPGATLKEIREAYKYLQEEYYPDYCSKSPQRQENAREALREIYSAYKKLKVLHKDHSEDTASEEEPTGVSVDNGSADGESALDQTEELWIDAGQDAYRNEPAGNLAQETVGETAFSNGKTDQLLTLTDKLVASKVEIDRLAAEKASVEKAAAEELAALKKDLDNLAGAKAQSEKALAEAMAIAGREAEKAEAEREAAEKRLAAEVAATHADAARISEERAAVEQRMREELAASKALIDRLIAEKEAVGMAAAEELAELKVELERTAAAEQAAAEEAAAAKAEIADLAAEKKDADKALAEAHAAAQREAERFAAERVTVAKEFAGQLSAIQAEVKRITEEKASVEKTLNEKLCKAKTDFDRLSAGMAAASTFSTVEHAAAKTRTVLPVSAKPTLVWLLKGLAYGGLVVAVCILAYSIATTRQSADRPSLMRPEAKAANTGKVAPPLTERKRVFAPAPVAEKQALPASSTAEQPAAASTTVKAGPTARSSKKGQTAASASEKKSLRTTGNRRVAPAITIHTRSETRQVSSRKHSATTMEIKNQTKPAELIKPAATTVKPAPPAVKTTAETKGRKNHVGIVQCVTPKCPKVDTTGDTGGLQTNKRYKVDMYPFARY
jgi:curved DNA-binding protein CbpA